ncbi:MAG: leucine-rich repeat domain-containing protein, partial [Oscillospiraceae bacterium]|nr:leucine-rich repeat domain-containing protein [Oscillospiraceae bacterium]
MSKFKRVLSACLALSVTAMNVPLTPDGLGSILPQISFSAFAADVEFGRCGEDLDWALDSDGTLTIKGKGAMYDWESGKAPWYEQRASITAVVLPDGLTSIGNYAFQGMTNLESITLPEGLTTIGENAFSVCTGLKEVEFPEGLTTIGVRAFFNTSLTKVSIPASMTEIGSRAFSLTVKLAEIEVAEGNPNYCSVDGILFNKDKTELVFYPPAKEGTAYATPDSVTSLHANAFDYSKLTDITLNEGLTIIGTSAFLHCKALTNVTLPESLIQIDTQAFYGCEGLESITFPEGLKVIKKEAFFNCNALTSVHIPQNVTSIEVGAFSYASSLSEITVDAENPAYTAVDGVLFSKDMTTLYRYPCAKEGETYVIPNSVTTVYAVAFRFSKLKNVTFPYGLETIGSKAFAESPNLEEASLPASVTQISSGAFENCNAMQKVYIRNPECEII